MTISAPMILADTSSDPVVIDSDSDNIGLDVNIDGGLSTDVDAVTISGATLNETVYDITVNRAGEDADYIVNGIYLENAAHINTVSDSTDIKVTNAGNASGIYMSFNTSIDSLGGTIDVESTAGIAYGVFALLSDVTSITADIDVSNSGDEDSYGILTTASSIDEIDADIDVTITGDGDAYGIYNNSSTLPDISSIISVITSGDGNATGIYNTGSTLADISGEIYVISSGEGKVIGIKSTSDLGQVTADITVQSAGFNAVGIETEGSIGVIDANITVTSTTVTESAMLAGIYVMDSSDDYTLTIAEGTTITVSGGVTNDAIYKLSGDLTVTTTESITGSTSDVVTINGGIHVATDSSFTFESGNYLLTSGEWTGGSVNICSGASVTIDGSVYMSFNTELNFYIDSVIDAPLLTLTDGSLISSYTSNSDTAYVVTLSITLSAEMTELYNLDPSAFNLNVIATENEADMCYFTDTVTTGVVNSLTLYGTDENGDTVTLTSLSTSDFVEAVPEPSTATLSLLALTALMARRRRKDK